MKQVNLVFPNQLFKESPLFDIKAPIYIVEEFLFFKQYPFHKQKIAFHRATMKKYADYLKKDKKFHESNDGKNISNYAVDGALHYSNALSKEFNVIAIAASGINEKNIKISNFLQLKNYTNKHGFILNIIKINSNF